MTGSPGCPLCGTPEAAEPVLDLRATDTTDHFTIERCPDCGVRRTAPVPADLAPSYATDLASTMTQHDSVLFSWLRSIQLGRELRLAARYSDRATILDVGCGSGDFAVAAKRAGHEVVAADASNAVPASLRDGELGIPYVRFDFESFQLDQPPAPSPYLVVLRHVLEHVRDPVAMLRHLAGYGASHFYIVVPNVDCVERRLFGRSWYLWDPPRHLWHFDRESLQLLCERAGLELVAGGRSTTATLLANLYRYLRVNGYREATYSPFGPTTVATALAAPLSLLIPGNVLWAVAHPK